MYISQPTDPCSPVDPIRIADTNTLVPGGGGATFSNFFKLGLDGTNVAFVGGVASNLDSNIIVQQGVYTVLTPIDPIFPPDPIRVADRRTIAPGGTTNLINFGTVAIDPGHVVFDAVSFQDLVHPVQGLYTNLTGPLTRLVDTTQSIGGKQLAAIHFGAGGFSNNQVVFEAEFADGTSGIAQATVSGNRCPASQGFWKNNPRRMPDSSLILGNQSYTQAELLNILGTSTMMDASLVVARQLIAAKLNVLHFSDPAAVAGTIANADQLLGAFPGKLPYAVPTKSTTGKSMVNDATVLQNYNADKLTPVCAP